VGGTGGARLPVTLSRRTMFKGVLAGEGRVRLSDFRYRALS